MRAAFKNTMYLTEAAINSPFMIEQKPIGNIVEVNDESFVVEIWDKYIGMETDKRNVTGLYLSTKEQYMYDEFMKLIK